MHPSLQLELKVRKVTPDGFDDAVAQLRRQVFTPESGPLITVTLLALGTDTHVLLVVVHHIVSDHASLGVFFDDLVTAYRGRHQGQAPQWTTSPIQFVDYALWQRDAFASLWGQAELAYWRDALAGLPDEVSVAHDYSRPPALGKRGRW